MNDPKGPRVRVRRRTRRHRRNRLIRRSLLAAVFVLGGLTGAALLPIDFGSFLASSFSSHPAPEWSSGDVRHDLALSAAAGTDASAPAKDVRPVYPYSIVPGGVHDPKELERVFERDPVVAAHYRGFDFRRARVLQLTEDKTVYVSYRIAGRVYWTTKKVRLRRGEKVITDGKMTLRTRCGNQVSETARQEVSPHEPAIAKLEQPIQIDPGTAMMIPSDFGSALTRPNLPVFGPSQPGYSFIANNGGLLSLYPPPLPSCGPTKTKKGGTSGGSTKKGKGVDCSNTPVGEVPEPGTLVLLSTGIAGAYFRYRNKSRA
ncbi:MAG: PEP-CTERM sorting domain-containing protein [Terriglobales bacterium]